ncbi:MAG TPA: phytanoyl-CoA dioxygenase family protein [Xanthomonadales bacterium]|nr:phytanoyl-CoA dioxygenase family protein [Xanthomonadales bacterium]
MLSIALPDRIASMILSTDQIQQSAHHYRLNGCLVMEDSFDPDGVRAMQSDFFENYASKDREVVEKTCLKVGVERYMFSVKLRKPWLDPRIYAAPMVLPIVQELLGKDCILQSVGVVCAYPGAEMQHVHRDHPPLFAEAGGLNAFFPPYALHVVIPLIDLDDETGTTALWEGSHRIKSAQQEARWSEKELRQLKGAILPKPKIGDCYFMDYRLRHTGTPNRSDRPRPILYLVYSRRWFLDRRNFDLQVPLDITPEDYGAIPQEHRSLFELVRPRDQA